MKKILSIIILTIYISNFQQSYALFGVGDIVYDPADVVQNTISAIAEPVTSIQQTLDTVNKTVLIPMRDALTLIQIVQNAKMITAIITGSMGSDGLLVTNPDLYLRNKALAVTQGGIDTLAKQNSIYGNSIINSVVTSVKYNSSSLNFKLTSINQSSIPNLQQKQICNNDTALSNMAKADTLLTGIDTAIRKTELFNSLCKCDPNADTPEGKQCAKQLTNFNNKNPSLDSFLAITQGDNAYTKSELSKLAISDDAAAKKDQAQKDLTNGGGIKSKTTCTKLNSTGGCIEETIQQTAQTMSDAYKKALGSGLNTAISSFGSGAGSLLGTIFTTISLVQGINTSIGSITGQTPNGNRPTTTSIPTTVSIPTSTTTTKANTTQTQTIGFTQDLVNNPQTKAVLAGTPMDQLNYHKDSLTKLVTTDDAFISSIDSYNSKLDVLDSCYNDLISNFPEDTMPGKTYGNQVSQGQNFVSTTKSTNNTTKNNLITELKKIDIANSLIDNTINTIKNSNSTDEITSTFQNYQNQIKLQNLPDLSSSVARGGEKATFDGTLQTLTLGTSQYSTLLNQCNSLRSQLSLIRTGVNGGGY